MPSAKSIVPQAGAEVTPSGLLGRSVDRRGLPALGLPTPGLRVAAPGRTCALRLAPGPASHGGCPPADFTGTSRLSAVQAAPLGTYANSSSPPPKKKKLQLSPQKPSKPSKSSVASLCRMRRGCSSLSSGFHTACGIRRSGRRGFGVSTSPSARGRGWAACRPVAASGPVLCARPR